MAKHPSKPIVTWELMVVDGHKSRMFSAANTKATIQIIVLYSQTLIDASDLILDAQEFRYSEPSDYIGLNDSTQNVWYADIGCTITSDVLDNILNPGIADQPGADVTCVNLNTNTPSSTAIKMNYQGWTGTWSPTRLWVGNIDDGGNNGQYHGDYTSDGIATWSNVAGTVGVYFGPTGRYYTSVAFWVR